MRGGLSQVEELTVGIVRSFMDKSAGILSYTRVFQKITLTVLNSWEGSN